MEIKKKVYITTIIQVKLFYQNSPPSCISARNERTDTAHALSLGHVVAVNPECPADVIIQLDVEAARRFQVRSSVQRTLNFANTLPLKSILKKTYDMPKPQGYGRVNPDKQRDDDKKDDKEKRKRKLSQSSAEDGGTRKKTRKTK